MDVNLKDKVIVITGGARGLGKAVVERLIRESAKVVVLYNHSNQEAVEMYEHYKKQGYDIVIEHCDVSNPNSVEECYKNICQKVDKIDALINNAGICEDNLMMLMKYQDWKSVIECNLNGVFLCSKTFAKKMIHQGYGKIVNIASLKGQEGCYGQTNYSASKAGVISLTKSMARELGNNNIAVNAVCPGFIETDLNRKSPNKKKIAQDRSLLSIESCLNDYINFLMLLLSDQIKGVSGQVFNLDARLK